MLSMMHPSVLRRTASVREVFRLRRLAQKQQGIWKSYVEQDRRGEAGTARRLMLEHLRGACEQWRLTLGFVLAGRPCVAAGLQPWHE
jgi:hypothetical protein